MLIPSDLSGSPDPIGIFLGGTQYALEAAGNPITATSPFLFQPIGITPPNSVTSYPGSSPPLLVGISATGAQTMVFAICDRTDTEWDSALMLKAGGCEMCDAEVKINYMTVTSTVSAGQEYTSTVKASGTVSGTVIIGATATATSTSTTSTTSSSSTVSSVSFPESNIPRVCYSIVATPPMGYS
jgi:hypothetical protein